jgi:hypothetical protein
MMTLPPSLLDAISSPCGGRVVLVLGAGCSIEQPTGIPSAALCSRECHRHLVNSGHLAKDECPDPDDLSSVADTVYGKTGKQALIVQQLLSLYPLRVAQPNKGYRLAAALLRERAIHSVITLNFDLALTHALVSVGIGNEIGIINGPADLVHQRGSNVYYIHRNANEPDVERWVLRRVVIDEEWRDHWEEVVTTRVLTAPIVVFAGLGDPAAVLIESTKRIKRATASGTTVFQVDPIEPGDSAFFAALEIDPANYVKTAWCAFMVSLARRVVTEQVEQLKASAFQHATENAIVQPDIDPLLDWLRDTDLLTLGQLRHIWLHQRDGYSPDEQFFRPLLADLLLGLALLAEVKAATATMTLDGPVELRVDGRAIACILLVSGRGSRSRLALEPDLDRLREQFRGRADQPTAVLVAGTNDNWNGAVAPPLDIAGDSDPDDIVTAPNELVWIHVSELRHDPHRVAEMVA